jgi:hypothetical protein
MRLLFALWLLLAPVCLAQDPKPVDMSKDSHYRLLLENDKVRVFELELRPLEQSYVLHDHNFLAVTLQDSEIVQWSEGQSAVANFRYNQGDVRFSFGGMAAGIRQDRTRDYRNVTVEFLNPKVTNYGYHADLGTWTYGNTGVPPPTDPRAKYITQLPLGEAQVDSVQLLSGDALPPPEQDVDRLVIAVTDIDLMNGSKRLRRSSGEIVWISSEQKTELKNRGGEAARFVVVELK